MGHLTHSSILAWGIPWTHGAWQATVHKVAKNQTQLSIAQHSGTVTIRLCFILF